MKTGDIILIPFPFAELTNKKVRPAVVVCETKDVYKDLVLCAVSSVVPPKLTENEILLVRDNQNGLRKNSVLKIDRIVTAKAQDVIAKIGELSESDSAKFKEKFKQLVA
ncbi:MAG: type II toxin-antitoxin system PemK/MazF family toxin [Acidobacteriota bacterium]|nr:type II toxin-antitoxin system PemK/MazF family toxin [Acidobacteriota bacterium]